MSKEIWKTIPGYKGCYEISNYGRIKSLDRYVTYKSTRAKSGQITVFKPGQLISPRYMNKRKYFLVTLFNARSIRKDHQLHRLVAITFIPNPRHLPCVNHKDENPENNYVNNLEWCTYKYNTNYGSSLQKRSLKQRITQPACKRIAQIDLSGSIYRVFYSQNEAARCCNVSAASIIRVCREKIIHTDGMCFKYITDTEYKQYQHLNNLNQSNSIRLKCHRNGRLVC